MPFPHRYQRLMAANDSQLQVTLQTLSISRNTLALPPRKPPTPNTTIFPPLPKPAPPPPPQPVLSNRMVKAIITAAVREQRRRRNRQNSANKTQQQQQQQRQKQQPKNACSGRPHTDQQHQRHQQQPRNTYTAKPHIEQQHQQHKHQSTKAYPAKHDTEKHNTETENKTEFRTAKSKLPLKRRAGLQSTRPRTQRLKPLHKRTCTTAATSEATNKEIPDVPNVDPRLVESVMSEMLEKSPNVDWDDIAGLQFAKNCVMEAVVWPMLRPDIFTGLRGPPKGLLLFGPPGTGKTMIGRAIASKSGARFFNISASSLVSKWAGEGEKTVRALFAVARVFQPAVVFIDEIDSLLTSRSEGEQEFSRRIKTEFLVQMDGAGTSRDDRVLVVGATNRPQELDEAARRRLVKRLYIPLPDHDARVCLIKRLLEKQVNDLSVADVGEIAKVTMGYSGSDMYALCAEAALAPVRELGNAITNVDVSQVRPVRKIDFLKAARMVRASVGETDLTGYREWNERFGSFPSGEGEGH